jgi:hypothetical protein
MYSFISILLKSIVCIHLSNPISYDKILEFLESTIISIMILMTHRCIKVFFVLEYNKL